ncbi:MAG: ParA family protein [Burkholderiaceae bacterium]|jgi:chromosome partitioning protein
MPVILIANPKGGVGKSTLATNLAGYFARQGFPVMLGDTDKQQSARAWLGLRPADLPTIQSWDIESGTTVRTPKGVSHVVLDTPAGLGGERLKDLLKVADKVIVPLQPSIFDILATREFLDILAERKPVRAGQASVGIVGMRVDARTRAADQLQRFVQGLGLPVLGYLRDTQNYVQLAAHGLTVWDVAPSRVEKDIVQWQPLLEWLGQR